MSSELINTMNRIRVYKLVDGKKFYSTWSNAMTVTTKK